MANRGWSLVIDASMLVAFGALQSWRFTGVPIHEWLGTALGAVILFHLVVHWGWVDSRVRQAFSGRSWRTRVNVALNTLLLAGMGVTIASGFYVSKVIVPNTLSPGAFMSWHELHEGATNATLVVLGLHLALNWDVIRGGLARARARGSLVPSTPATILGSGPSLPRRLAWVGLLVATLAAATSMAGRLLPAEAQVLFIRADGRRELAAPPPEVRILRPGTERPHLDAFAKPLGVLGVTTVLAAIGRKVLRLRLG